MHDAQTPKVTQISKFTWSLPDMFWNPNKLQLCEHVLILRAAWHFTYHFCISHKMQWVQREKSILSGKALTTIFKIWASRNCSKLWPSARPGGQWDAKGCPSGTGLRRARRRSRRRWRCSRRRSRRRSRRCNSPTGNVGAAAGAAEAMVFSQALRLASRVAQATQSW